MSFKHPVEDCLDDIIENAALVASYIDGYDLARFERDQRTRDAVERCLERVSEAATRLGDRGPALIPDQPWPRIRAIGNQLRHGYDGIELPTIWRTATDSLPSLSADAARVRATMTADGEDDAAP